MSRVFWIVSVFAIPALYSNGKTAGDERDSELTFYDPREGRRRKSGTKTLEKGREEREGTFILELPCNETV